MSNTTELDGTRELDEPITEEQAKELSVFDLNYIGTHADIEDAQRDEPLEPNIDTKERDFYEKDVVYRVAKREPEDAVLSGPVIGGWGPGRYHQNRFRAYTFLVEKYGEDRVRRLEGQTKGRWSFLIKGIKDAR